jgi:molybdopterin-binding protein
MEDGRITEVGTSTEIFGRLSKTLASFAAVENTFAGTAKISEDGSTLIDVGNGIQIVAATKSAGEVSVFVSPEDIILSRNRFESSARNVLQGRIVDIQDSGSVVRLKVDVGKPFTVQITKRSFNEMKLNLDAEVFLAFKASSVQII